MRTSKFLPIVTSLPILCTSLSCHQVTEYRSSDSCTVHFLDADQLQVTGSMGELEGGRCLFPQGTGELVLVTSEGVLYRIDTVSMSVDTSYAIGGSSGDGYTDGARAGNGNLYVLGPGSQVIEVDLASNSVLDAFVPGPDPVAICASPVLPRMYFADGTGLIGEIWTSDNHTGNLVNLASPPADIMVEPAGGMHIVAAGTDQQGTLYDLWLEYSQQYPRTLTVNASSPASCIVPFGMDSCFAVGCPEWTEESGHVCFVRGYVDSVEVSTRGVQGHPVDMCFNGMAGFKGRLYVMSRTDVGSTVITAFDFPGPYLDPVIAGTAVLDGYPRDLVSPGDGGTLIVLTSDI